MKLFAIALAGCLLTTVAFAFHDGDTYHSTDGSIVHVPYHTNQHVEGETAVCRDGTHSMSHHHQGTCSHHGSVEHFD